MTVVATPRTEPAPAATREVPPAPGGSRADSLPPLSPPSQGGGGDSRFGGGGRLTVGPPPAGGGSSDAGQSSPPSTGYIKITVGPPKANSGGGNGSSIPAAPPRGDGGDLDGDPLRRAQRLQSMGRYSEAVGAYQDAVATGAGSSGSAHQGMALAYQRQGDTAAARNAYRQAISAYEAQIASGKNVSAAKRGLDSCKAALEVLGAN